MLFLPTRAHCGLPRLEAATMGIAKPASATGAQLALSGHAATRSLCQHASQPSARLACSMLALRTDTNMAGKHSTVAASQSQGGGGGGLPAMEAHAQLALSAAADTQPAFTWLRGRCVAFGLGRVLMSVAMNASTAQ